MRNGADLPRQFPEQGSILNPAHMPECSHGGKQLRCFFCWYLQCEVLKNWHLILLIFFFLDCYWEVNPWLPKSVSFSTIN